MLTTRHPVDFASNLGDVKHGEANMAKASCTWAGN
jgi:hypothetical protein